MNRKSRHLTMAVLFTAAVMLVAGSVAIASNTGFKLNMQLWATNPAGTPAQQGNNWVGLPYFNPYPNADAFCTATGLPGGGLVNAVIGDLDPATGVARSAECGTPGAIAMTLVPGRGIRVRLPYNAPVVPGSIIIVGSHDPALSLFVPDIDRSATPIAAIGNFWFSVPYHTTASTVNELCTTSGFTVGGLTPASVVELNAGTGVFTTHTCGLAPAALALGKAYRVRDAGHQATGGHTFIPAHF